MPTFNTATRKHITELDRVSAELFNVQQVAELINASQRTVYRLADAGRMPRPLKLGSLVRWRADELHQWITADCPSCRGAKGGGR